MQGLQTLGKTSSSILMLWHDRLIIIPFIGKICKEVSFIPVVSHSRDGQILAAMTARYPNGKVISVPHNAKHHALREIVKQLKQELGMVVITPDGPRGPRHLIKSGAAFAAIAADCLIVPLSWSADRFWKLSSWDQFLIPKPFAKINITWGPPIHPQALKSQDPSTNKKILKDALDSITKST